MQCPPRLAPDSLDLVRLLAAEQLSDFALQDRVDSGAISSCGVRIAHAFGAIGVGEPDRIEFKSAHLAVCAVGEHDGERNAIKTASYRGDIGHEVLLCTVAGRAEDCRGRAGRASRAALLTQVQSLTDPHWRPRRHYRISPVR